ncbi:hypothetical protein ONZ45_g5078 [Pleurotus djamor]|nr:hypothetical protein ONZ45_g5078 [Pleurotus djamor]
MNQTTSMGNGKLKSKERHRALSLVFHPDKQHDENAKEVANKKFLEIQKAYEVLSDPFTREVYDTLGNEGLSIKWPPSMRNRPVDELRSILKQARYELKQQKLENLIRPRGLLTCSYDASSLFSPYPGSPSDPWHKDVASLNTSFSATAQVQTRPTSATFLGTVKHQFSPKLALEASASLLSIRPIRVRGTYRDGENAIVVATQVSPAWLYGSPSPVTVNLTRKLFPGSLTEGNVALNLGRFPAANIGIISQTPFDASSDKDLPPQFFDEDAESRSYSVSGLSRGVRYNTYGIVLDDNPRLKGEMGVRYAELALQLKGGLEFGVHGLAYYLGANWTGEHVEVDATLNASQSGVVYKLDVAYLEQRISLPLILSLEYDPNVAFWCAVVPSVIGVLGYQFVVKPRRRAQRLSHIRTARRMLVNQRTSIAVQSDLLKDVAKKHMDLETSKDGLVIQEAIYGAFDVDAPGDDLTINVTVALQALVHHSQLYVPGNQTKLGIQGFSDPAPFTPKVVRIRYQFRGRNHYAEIPDAVPIVLPQADHAVD